MKIAYGLSALLLGTTLLAGGAMADDPHPHFTPHHSHASRGDDSTPPSFAPAPQARANANAGAAQNNHNGGWYSAQRNAGTRSGNGGHGTPYWSSANLRDRNVAHFSAQDRSTWQHGRWSHGRHHGRNGWWWNSGGSWFLYDQPVYPYPGYVSDDYYADDYDGYDGGGNYGDYGPAYAADPRAGGYYWYYCNDPAGYYPYVKSCHGPWRAVTPTPDAQQQGADQGQDGYGNDDDRGAPQGYNGDDRGAPPGYNNDQAPRGDQFNGPQDDDDRGPPPGYNGDDRGPPPGYDNGPDDDDNGPPPPQSPR